MRSFSLLALAGLITTISLACSGNGPAAPSAVAQDPFPSALALPLAPGAITQQTVAMFEVALNLDTLTATSTPLVTRTAQQSELYSLSLENFSTPRTFRITGITGTPTTLDIAYTTSHPFDAPTELDGPPSLKNRADLALTGRILWLLDDPDAATYFPATDQVRVNTRLVTNPDGYFKPDGLISDPGITSNTFPYQTLVDERANNRIGVDNLGQIRGNFGGFGWQKDQFADGIRGYGIWGQGQTTTHTLKLDRALVGLTGTFRTRVALVVKYEDPRGGTTGIERRSNRLPTDDVTKFTYRMPHGALDMERIKDVFPVYGFTIGQFNAALVEAKVVDWDTRAIEAAQVNLVGETDPSLVSLGESGEPTLTCHVPGIPGTEAAAMPIEPNDPGPGGDPQPESGDPFDPLFYRGTIAGTPTLAGNLTGLIRAIDPTDLNPPTGWDSVRRNLAPDLADLGTHLEGAVYQSFTVVVATVESPPSSSWVIACGPNAIDSLNIVTLTLGTPVLDVSNTTGNYSVDINWGDGTPIVPINENTATGSPTYTHRYTYTGVPPTSQVRTIAIQVTDSDTPSLTATASIPMNPNITVLAPPSMPGWAKKFGGAALDFGFDVAVAPDGTSVLAGGVFSTVDFGGGPLTNGGSSDPYLVKLDAAGNHLWSKTYPGTGNDFFRAVTMDTSGNVYAHGEFETPLDFGGGILTPVGAQDGVVLKLDSNGVHQWSKRYGGGGSETSTGAEIDGGGNLVFSGYSYSGSISFFGGPATAFSPHYLVRVDPSGNYQMQYTISAGGASTGGLAVIPGNAGYVLVGSFSVYSPGGVNFGGGLRSTAGSSGTDAYFIGMDSSGSYLWDYTAGDVGGDSGQGVVALSNGTIIGCGDFAGTVNFAGIPKTAIGTQDIFLVTLNSGGAQTGIATFGGPGNNWAYDLAVDSTDSFILAAGLGSSADFGGGSVNGGVALAKFSCSGAYVWDHVFAPGSQARAVEIGPSNMVYIGGDFVGTADFQPGPGVTNLSSAGSLDCFITRLKPDRTW